MADDDIKAPPGLVLEPPADQIQPPSGLVLEPVTPPATNTPTPNITMPYELPKSTSSQPGSSPLQQFGQGFWSQVDPINAARGVIHAFQNPAETGEAIVKAHKDLWGRASDAWKQGRYAEALDLAGSGLLPVIGPQIQAIEDEAKAGHAAKALGMGAGFVAPALVTAGAGKLIGGIGKAGQAAAEAEEVLPVATEAETAADVAKTSSPETALQDYMRARNIEKLKEAYNVASPDMRQTLQQQAIFQNARAAGGDVGKFGELMEETRQALPYEDHQAWKGVTKAVQASAGKRLMKAGARFIPGVGGAIDFMDAAKAASDLMGSAAGRGWLAKLGSLSPSSPAFDRMWTLMQASAKAGGSFGTQTGNWVQQQPFQPELQGDMLQRLRNNTLDSLRSP